MCIVIDKLLTTLRIFDLNNLLYQLHRVKFLNL